MPIAISDNIETIQALTFQLTVKEQNVFSVCPSLLCLYIPLAGPEVVSFKSLMYLAALYSLQVWIGGLFNSDRVRLQRKAKAA